MLSIVKSMALHGLNGYLVSVEVDVSSGLPAFDVVGLPDVSIKEAKERVRTAIKNSGEEFFSRKIVVNLAPAATKKEGSGFDLPIAVGILMSMEAISSKNAKKILENTIVIGELSLNGKVNKINGILPITIEAFSKRNKKNNITERKPERGKHCKRCRNNTSFNLARCKRLLGGKNGTT